MPRSGLLATVEFGFSGLPRLALHATVAEDWSVGPLIAFDYASYLPESSFDPKLLLAAAVRTRIALGDTGGLALRADPGILIGFSGGSALALDLAIALELTIADRLVIAPGLNMPMVIGIRGKHQGLAWPLLLGASAEYHILAPLALTLDFKLGPYLVSNAGAYFGLRLLGGAAYRF